MSDTLDLVLCKFHVDQANFNAFKNISCYFVGQRTKIKKDLLQGEKLQKAHPSQSHPVQDRKSVPLCSGCVIHFFF